MNSDRHLGTTQTIVGVFPDRESAREAAHELHDAGYGHMWIGTTKPLSDEQGMAGSSAGTVVEEEGDVLEKIGRFFSGDRKFTLGEALREHGVSESDARRVESSMPAGRTLLTAAVGEDRTPTGDAATVIEQCGGRLLTADYGQAGPYSHTSAYDEAVAGSTSVANAGAVTADEKRRIQLREERLSVNKQQVATGEARVRKDIVTEQASVDVPTFHEELFIERHPVTDEYDATGGPIGAGETIRVPLSEERVSAEKRTVVTEEVTIGKTRVNETQHVNETLEKEVLNVEDDTTGRRSSPNR